MDTPLGLWYFWVLGRNPISLPINQPLRPFRPGRLACPRPTDEVACGIGVATRAHVGRRSLRAILPRRRPCDQPGCEEVPQGDCGKKKRAQLAQSSVVVGRFQSNLGVFGQKSSNQDPMRMSGAGDPWNRSMSVQSRNRVPCSFGRAYDMSCAQTRPVWDCQDGLPRNGQGWFIWGLGRHLWQSPTGRVWAHGFGAPIRSHPWNPWSLVTGRWSLRTPLFRIPGRPRIHTAANFMWGPGWAKSFMELGAIHGG